MAESQLVRTRDQITCTGESRSQLFQRLRNECRWNQAEQLKEEMRVRCRAEGLTKAESGRQAWNEVARQFPPVSAELWFQFTSRVRYPPKLSSDVEVTESDRMVGSAWSTAMILIGSLATVCPEIRDQCHDLLQSIDRRRADRSVGLLILSDSGISRLEDLVRDNPLQIVADARHTFEAVNPDSEICRDELFKLRTVIELTPELIAAEWDRIKPWLFGPDREKVRRALARACEISADIVKPNFTMITVTGIWNCWLFLRSWIA